MATPDLTSGQVMDSAAALMNDAAKSIYSYTIQLPYLNIALQELQETFELYEMPVTDTVTDAVMTLPANNDRIGFGIVAPFLPIDMIEPQYLWERITGIDPYTPMARLKYLPRYMEGVENTQLIWYVWESQQLRFMPASASIDIKMDYIRNLFVPFTQTNGTDQVNIINAASFLEYKTASLLSNFVGENPTRAKELAGESELAMDRSLGISIKGRQSTTTRRRPFRSSYKRRQYA